MSIHALQPSNPNPNQFKKNDINSYILIVGMKEYNCLQQWGEWDICQPGEASFEVVLKMDWRILMWVGWDFQRRGSVLAGYSGADVTDDWDLVVRIWAAAFWTSWSSWGSVWSGMECACVCYLLERSPAPGTAAWPAPSSDPACVSARSTAPCQTPALTRCLHCRGLEHSNKNYW